MEIFEELNGVFCRVFDNPEIRITRESTVNDIEEWDSFTHTVLVVTIEKHFKIKFKSSEILRWKNTGEMYDAIKAKLAEKG